jgi:hypothetical protein
VLCAGFPKIRFRRKITKQVYHFLPGGFYDYAALGGIFGKRKGSEK